MDSADAAPPPKAPPLPSEAPSTTAKSAPSICNAKTAVSPQESTTAVATLVSPATIKALPSNTTTKKRPLASTNHSSEASKPAGTAVATSKETTTTPTLVVPGLKSKSNIKETPLKAKKTLKKKKKKKFSSILFGMMKPKKELDVQAEREAIRKSLGGGNFIKVDKI